MPFQYNFQSPPLFKSFTQNLDSNRPTANIDEYVKIEDSNESLAQNIENFLINIPCSNNVDEIILKKSSNENGIQSFKKRSKKTYGRTISYILDKLHVWRKYYNGFQEPTSGEIKKLSLQEAAKKVDIPYKSLNDYLLLLKYIIISNWIKFWLINRQAQKYGFEFKKYENKGFGYLRRFVQKKRKEEHNLEKTKVGTDFELNQI